MGFQTRLFKLAALVAWATLVAHARGEDCHSHSAQNEIVAKVDKKPNQKDLVLANPRQDPSGAMEGSRYHRQSFLERGNSAKAESADKKYPKQEWLGYPHKAQQAKLHNLTEQELEEAFLNQAFTRVGGPTWEKPSGAVFAVGEISGMHIEPKQTSHLFWRWELRLEIPEKCAEHDCLTIVAWANKTPVVVGNSKYYIISRLGYRWDDFRAGKPLHGDWAMYEYYCQHIEKQKWETLCDSDYPWYALKLKKNEELNEESTEIDSRGEFKKMSQGDWVA